MSDRRALIIALAWILGAGWILVPHPYEGPVLWVISTRYEMGVHLTDPLGIACGYRAPMRCTRSDLGGYQ